MTYFESIHPRGTLRYSRFMSQTCLAAVGICIPLVCDNIIDVRSHGFAFSISQWCLYLSIVLPCVVLYSYLMSQDGFNAGCFA